MLTTALSFLSLLFLAAHGLRIGSVGIALFWAMGACLSLTPWRWKHGALAGLLGFGSWLWLEVGIRLFQVRLAHGHDYQRLVMIIGAVGLLTLTAALLQGRALRNRLQPGPLAQGATFLLAVGGLALARQKSSLDILLADRFVHDGGWVTVFLLGAYGALVVGRMLTVERSAKWRRAIWTLFSAVFFSQLLLGLLGFKHFLMTGNLHLPVPALIAAGPLFRGEGLFMIILFSATLLLVGPAWCSHLCYIGAWDNLAANAQRKTEVLPGWTRVLRWLLCGVVLGVAYAFRRLGMPVSSAAIWAAAFGLAGVAVMLFWSRRTGTMTHCITYCPMGLLADIFGRINPWRIRIHRDCNLCGLCSRRCRYNALLPSDLDQHRAGFNCSLCGDCLAVCPHGHLYYHFPWVNEHVARTGFLVVIVALHAIFLGVARL